MKNYYGDEVMEKRFRNPSFGYIDSHGNAHVNWASENDGVQKKCMVQRGKVAPMFDSPGGAVQYKHYQSIAKELDDGVLMEVHL